MELILYTPKGESSFRIIPDETSSHDWSLMSDNKLSVTFDWNICVDLSPGCYVDFDGVRYYLLEKYKPIMVSSTLWRYNVTFKDAASWLGITLALNNADGQNKPIFQYTAPAIEHVKIIVDNLNRRMETTLWKVGSVIESANISIDYHSKYCSEVLQELVDIQNTEWWVDDFTLNLGRAEFGERVELGYQNGLIGDISCAQPDNMHLYAYLYPIGSTRNIDPTKYGYDRLQLPNGQTTVEMNVEHGVAELYEEAAFAHIFPRYEGTVQSVRSKTAIGNDGTQFTIYYFQDSYIPFNPNDYEIAGLVKNISFLSGELMGEDFVVNYDHSNHEFEIITRYPKGSVMQLPGGFLIPKVGDKYTIWNITMPEEYYPLASQEFLEAAQTFAITAQQDASVYKGETDYIDIQIRGVSLRPGQRVRLFSAEYFPLAGYYDSRITRITRKLWYPEEIKVDISASRSVGTIAKLSSGLKTVERKTNTLSTSVTTISSTLVAFKSLFDSMFEVVDGNIHAKLSLWSSGGITAGGVGSGSTSGGGASYDRLDDWGQYAPDKVLSALLGKQMYDRIGAIEGAGYITQSALANYALRSEIPSLEGYATQSWVESKNYLTGVTSSMVVNALGYTPYNVANFTKANIKSTLGISDWALASVKPTYTASEVGALGVNSAFNAEVLTDLNNATAWKFFTMTSGYGSTDGNKPNIAWPAGLTGNFAQNNAYKWQLAGTTGYKRPYWRIMSNNTWQDWSTLAFVSDIPTKLSQLTDDVVSGKYLPLSGGTISEKLAFSGAKFPHIYGDGSKLVLGCANLETYGSIVLENNALRRNGSAPDITLGTNSYKWKHIYGNGLTITDVATFASSVTAPTFIGNLTGNADSASLLSIKGNQNPDSSDIGQIFASPYNEYVPSDAASYISGLTLASNGDPNYKVQLGIDYYGKGFIRYQAGGTWYNWKRLAFITDNVASATKLATPRTIWGQSFDGTQDITGALTAPSVTIGGITLTYDATNNAVCVNGNLYATGGVTAGGASDARLKQNVATMTEQKAISTIMALRPVTFEWNALARSHDGRLYGNSQGFIAQEFERLIENSGRAIYGHYRAIDTTKAIPYLTTIAQNHERRIAVLEQENKALREEVERLKQVA